MSPAPVNTERLQQVARARAEKLQTIYSDPYIGYSSLDEAYADYRFTPQVEVLARLLNRESLFISGPAGSGKTTILNRFIDIIDAKFEGQFDIAVTASTGIAATLLGGATIHSWAGLGIDTEPFNVKKINPMQWSKRDQMRNADVLIIDEISMLPAYLFEKLDASLRWARRSNKPFGGIQLVLTGDFLQLPPVSKAGETVNTDYAIATDSWKKAGIGYAYMDKTHRASDKKLKYVLGRIAQGRGVEDYKVGALVESRMGSRQLCDPDKTYTTLFTTNKNVDQFNQDELDKNEQPLQKSRAKELGAGKHIEKIYKSYSIPKTFDYKKGASVMLTANIRDVVSSKLYANGSLGTVTDVIGGIPRVRFNDGATISITPRRYPLEETTDVKMPDGTVTTLKDEVAFVEQLPLKLGYAITVHKSQGQTFDGVVADLSKCFTPGLGYVALSRVRQLEDLVVLSVNDRAYGIDERSRKISTFVKKKAHKAREEFLEKKEFYDAAVSEELSLDVMWDVEQSAAAKRARPKGADMV